jgi:hypothetical protein
MPSFFVDNQTPRVEHRSRRANAFFPKFDKRGLGIDAFVANVDRDIVRQVF